MSHVGTLSVSLGGEYPSWAAPGLYDAILLLPGWVMAPPSASVSTSHHLDLLRIQGAPGGRTAGSNVMFTFNFNKCQQLTSGDCVDCQGRFLPAQFPGVGNPLL